MSSDDTLPKYNPKANLPERNIVPEKFRVPCSQSLPGEASTIPGGAAALVPAASEYLPKSDPVRCGGTPGNPNMDLPKKIQKSSIWTIGTKRPFKAILFCKFRDDLWQETVQRVIDKFGRAILLQSREKHLYNIKFHSVFIHLYSNSKFIFQVPAFLPQ